MRISEIDLFLLINIDSISMLAHALRVKNKINDINTIFIVFFFVFESLRFIKQTNLSIYYIFEEFI